jgi:hypothetical protein
MLPRSDVAGGLLIDAERPSGVIDLGRGSNPLIDLQ